ncbi:MAG TPA: C45 family peptidase, partial [Armatimonadota bacterium]
PPPPPPRRYRQAIESLDPDYAAGMLGIAEGSGFDPDEIAALNVRYEIMYSRFGAMATAAERAVDGCTAFAVLPESSANAHAYLGQNWDWIPQVRCAVLQTAEPGALETLAFTEAGIFGGKIGLNAAGLGLCVNGMTTTDDDGDALLLPFHARCRRALRSATLEEGMRAFTDGNRACAGNFLLAHADGCAVDLETAPFAVRALTPTGGRLVHTNHFLDPGVLGVTEPPMERRPWSCHRLNRFGALLSAMGPATPEALMEALRDHDGKPFSVCRHEDWSEPPSEHYITVSSIVMDLTERRLWLTDGPPCGSSYQPSALAL